MIDLAKKKIAVTGGGGFLGSAVVEALQRRGVPAQKLDVVRTAMPFEEGLRRTIDWYTAPR